MSGYLTADHLVKKKSKIGDLSLSENVFYSQLPELEGSGEEEEEEKKKKKKKKKNKHRSTDDETLMDVGSLDNLSPSCSRSISTKFKEQEDTSEQVLSNQDYNSNTRKSPKKSKKKKHIEVPVEKAVEETDHTDQPSLYYHGYSDEVAVSGEVLHSESVRKKKKRHRPSETRSVKEEVLEDVQQTSSEVTVNLDIDVENSVRKKKKKHKLLEEDNLSYGIQQTVELSSQCQVASKKSRQKGNEVSVEEAGHTGQPSFYDRHSNEVAVSEEDLNSESVRKKKRRHRPSESRSLEEEVLENVQETSPLVTVNEDDNVENSVRKKKKRHKYDILEKEHLRDDIQQTVELSNLCQVTSKKSRQKNQEVSVEETDHTGQRSLYDCPTDEVAVSEESLHSESVRKKKKRHRATGADGTFSDEREPRTVGFLSPNVRNSEKVTVTEDMSFNDTDLESSERKKKKRKHRTKEVDSQTESSICKRFKSYTSPEPNGEDVAVAERPEKVESGKYLHASENITEPTNSKTDAENAGTPAKLEESVKLEMSEGNQDQDVTAKLEESDKNQMETTLDEETSVQRPKRRGQSANELLCTIPERDRALLEEYFPKIRSRAGRTVEDLCAYELQRIKAAKEKGIKFETGRFDRTEDELIKKNVDDFMKLMGLESGEMLFHSYRFPDEKCHIEKLKKKYHFRQRIAIGVARTVKQVQNRGSKLYDLSGNKGRFTKDDVEKLQKGMSEYGNNWTAVANLVGRNNTLTQLKASQLRHDVTGGKWSVEEVNRLLTAIKKFILSSLKRKKRKNVSVSEMETQTVPKEMLFTGIPWAKIEKRVKTRNWTHCKSKWNDILLVRMNTGIRYCERLFGLQTNIDIIKWLHEAELPKGQVNWLEMAKAIGNIPPGILQQKVYKLKARYVPDWQSLSFQEIVDILYQEVLPKLEAKVNLVPTSQDTFDLPEKKDEFLIGDIFEEYGRDDQYRLSKPLCDED